MAFVLPGLAGASFVAGGFDSTFFDRVPMAIAPAAISATPAITTPIIFQTAGFAAELFCSGSSSEFSGGFVISAINILLHFRPYSFIEHSLRTTLIQYLFQKKQPYAMFLHITVDRVLLSTF